MGHHPGASRSLFLVALVVAGGYFALAGEGLSGRSPRGTRLLRSADGGDREIAGVDSPTTALGSTTPYDEGIPSTYASPVNASPAASYLRFDGMRSYVEIPTSDVFSLRTGGGLTVSAWIRPATLKFPTTEGSGYVHWMGKGEKGQYEWVFRMYSQGNRENRGNRISFYVFNAQGGEGVGSYFEDAIIPGQWIQVVGVADAQRTYMYKNGEVRRCDQYKGAGDGSCVRHPIQVDPESGAAPVRIGTRDLKSFFEGEIREVRIWDRALTASEISGLYSGRSVPQKGLAAEYLLTDGTARDSKGGHNGKNFGASWIPQK